MTVSTSRPSPADNPKFFAQEFIKGFLEPSFFSVTSALSVCAIICLFCLFVINEDFFISERHRYFLSDASDDSLLVTSEALQMFRLGGKKMLVVSGASSTRVSVIKNKLAEVAGPSFLVFKLCMGRESLWETAKLLDMIPEGTEGVVVIGLGPSRFTRAPEDLIEIANNTRIGFNTEAFDEELELNGIQPERQFGNYVLDNQTFLIVRLKYLIKNLLSGPPAFVSRYFGRERASEEELERISNRVFERFEFYEKNYEFNQSILERIILRLKDKTGMRIVLLEHPVDPGFIQDYLGKEFYWEHKDRVGKFALKHGISYWNAADVIGFEEDDFYDWTHLRKFDLAEQYTGVLAELLIELDATGTEKK